MTTENDQRLVLLAELIEVLPRESQDKIASLIAGMLQSSFIEGRKSHSQDWYKQHEPPNINIYPNRSK